MTYAECGALVGKSERFIRNLVAKGRLTATYLSHKCHRIAPLDWARYIEACRTLEKWNR